MSILVWFNIELIAAYVIAGLHCLADTEVHQNTRRKPQVRNIGDLH